MKNKQSFSFEWIERISGPIVLLVIYIGLVAFLRTKISDPKSFLILLQGLYGQFGYQFVFVGAFLESLFLIGLYVPGSTAVLLGAAMSKTGVVEFPTVFLLATTGVVLGYSINYVLGRYGWYNLLNQFGLEKGIQLAKEKLEKHAFRTIFLGYFFPGSASILSTAAGAVKMPFITFLYYSILAQCFWSFFWGTISYTFGLTIIEFLLQYFVFFVLAVVVIWFVVRFVRK